MAFQERTLIVAHSRWGEVGAGIRYGVSDELTASGDIAATYGSATEASYRMMTSLSWHP